MYSRLRKKIRNNEGFTLIELLVLIFVLLTLFGILVGLRGCAASPPYFPRTDYGSAQEVVIKPANVNVIKLVKGSLFQKESKIAVFKFDSPNTTQGGALVSDMFSTLLQQKGFKVVERDNIDRILREQKLILEGKTIVSDLEVARRLGQLIAADYMVFGTVTLYQAEPQSIYIPIKIKKEDREEYEKEYTEYRDKYVNSWLSFWVPKDKKIKQLREDAKVLSISEIETELGKLAKNESRVIATVGISSKVVDVKSGGIIWQGQGEANDFTTVNASKRVLEDFIKAMQK
ncbi:MAG: CsgG/HfaB family protein [bacterium]|nr:CsgG/HfaB family protein [bacterium]